MQTDTAVADRAAHHTSRLLATDARHGWRRRETPAGVLHTSGDPAAETAVVALLETGRLPDASALASAVIPARGFWALLIEGPAGVAAAVDHVRNLPLFYAETSRGAVVGDDPRALAATAGLQAIDPIAAEELALSGYALGSRTLLAGLLQVQAGEVVVWRNGAPATHARHHEYRPPEMHDVPRGTTRELSVALDAAIDRLIRKAGGRPIAVPLSGGMDSRFVLAKLVERAYRPVLAFSYGPSRNSDAEIARMVADRLGVGWQFVSTPGPQIRAFFNSPERKDYWRFADGLSALPSMQDVNPIAVLRQSGGLPDDAMIVNGNSGDFISGAHIPQRLLISDTVTPRELLDAITDKHFALWRRMANARRRQELQDRIAASLGLDPNGPPMTKEAATSAYERHEYAERQSKFVVNGQRSYEWHGHGWDLPLWDRDVCDLFARMPLEDRANQSLYDRYLHEWDYRGVFTGITRPVTAWPRWASAALAPVAVGVRLVAGRARRDRLFRYLSYFDRFGDHYKVFGFREFAQQAHDARNPAALYVRTWLRENGVDFEELAGA